MIYKIKTEDAEHKLATLITCVNKGKDLSNKRIDSWEIDKRDTSDLFIHTADQWSDKGYLICNILDNKRNDTIIPSFYYWSDCKEDNKSPYDEGIILGRFTELLLNHFQNLISKIEISKSI